MTAETNDNPPIGRKFRIGGDCPTYCARPAADHANDEGRHFGADQLDPTGSLIMYLASTDGEAPRVEIGLTSGSSPEWSWTMEQAQQFVEQLQSLLASGPGLVARPDALPTAREIVAQSLLQRLEPHPATLAGRALEVLARVREPEDLVSIDMLGEIQTLHALIDQGKHALDEATPDGEPTAETALIFRSLVHLEQQRRALMARLVEAPA